MPNILERLIIFVGSHKRHLVMLPLAGASLGVLIGHLYPIHKVRAYVRYHALNQELFRQVSFNLSETSAIRAYFAENAPNAEYARKFLANEGSAGNIYRTMVTQVYPPPRQQALSGDTAQRRGVGLVITADGRDKTLLHQQVNGMRNCLADTLVLAAIGENYLSEMRKSSEELLKSQVKLTTLREDMKSLTNRIKDLRDLTVKYPDAAKVDNRQVVDVRGEASRFMPLQQQIIAAEAGIVDLAESTRRSELQAKQLEVMTRYYTESHQIIEQATSWQKLYPVLEALRRRIFTAEVLSDPMLKDALGAIIDSEQDNLYKVSSIPTAADSFKTFGRTIGGLLGLVLGALLFSIMALWRVGREAGWLSSRTPAL